MRTKGKKEPGYPPAVPSRLEHCLPSIPFHLGDKVFVHLNAEYVPGQSWNAKSEAAENNGGGSDVAEVGSSPTRLCDAENASQDSLLLHIID